MSKSQNNKEELRISRARWPFIFVERHEEATLGFLGTNSSSCSQEGRMMGRSVWCAILFKKNELSTK
jgi:hypothetical protein